MTRKEGKTVYTIPGESIMSLEGFYKVMGEAINGPGGYFGGNLDAFADCLAGGFGTPEEGYIIRWRNAEVSKSALGYSETVRQLERKLASCHPLARQSVVEDLERAKRGEGRTVFDWLVEIIGDTEGVELELD